MTTHNQAWHSNNADVVPYVSAMIQNIVKENQDTQQTLTELATNISLLTKKFDESQIKKGVTKDRTTKVVTRIRINGDFSKVKVLITTQGTTTIIMVVRTKGATTTTAILRTRVPILYTTERAVNRARAEKKVVDLEPIDEEDEVQSEAPIIVDENPADKKVADIPKIVKDADNTKVGKKKEDAKFKNFYDQLKQLSLNFPFLEAIKEMPGFAKYLKDLLTKKKMVQHETVSLTHTVSSIISTTTIQKKGDPEAFTIPCSVGHHDFARALCDNRASINLMPLAIYKQ
ncbi:uncharacterized protein LOC132061517 [Lycium ferocissimum]|uniref:uncharacterized protein LOC132061517 n=1 Tax=Lycium ferocissimum TaxID=112874 RepID=UPI002815B17A|nr:uncharacterized protein LOC132061517 [Lycium ferocissimum]